VDRVLVAEDDATMARVLRYRLSHAGYRVSSAVDGMQALRLAREDRPDLLLLDVMLPGIDGFELCRVLRGETDAPIILLTARAEEVDRVVGLEVGADDYVTKPFSVRELLARIHACLRRAQYRRSEQSAADRDVDPETTLRVGELEIDLCARRVRRSGHEVQLKRREFDLLAFMAQNSSIVIPRGRLRERVWADEVDVESRTVDVHIRRLRSKLEEDPSRPRHIHTVRGIGYSLRCPK
jgi:DNA-binding response OmpR family regulator